MILKVGAYQFDQNEVEITIDKRASFNERGYRDKIVETWFIKGIKQAATQAALTTALDALKTAVASDYVDVGLYLDDGTTLTHHYLSNSSTLSGVRIGALRFPVGTGAEYSTYRTYEIEIVAEFGIGGTNGNLVSFQETITFQGGGPRFVLLQTLTGKPQKQLVAQSTPYFAFQSGSAVQLGARPNPSPPIWPDAEHLEERRVTIRGPDLGRGFTGEWGLEWSYTFESPTVLNGTPTIR